MSPLNYRRDLGLIDWAQLYARNPSGGIKIFISGWICELSDQLDSR